MKISFGSTLIFGAAVAFVRVAAAPCNTAALSQLSVTEKVGTCRADSGYSLTSMTIPSDAQVTAFCNSDACEGSINAVKQAIPDECTIGPIRLYANVLNPLSQRCGMSSGLGSVSASGSASGPTAGDVGSGSIAGNTISTASASMSGSAMNYPTPQPNTSSPSDSPTSTPTPASGYGGAGAPTLSVCASIAVVATVIAAIL